MTVYVVHNGPGAVIDSVWDTQVEAEKRSAELNVGLGDTPNYRVQSFDVKC